MHYIVATLEFKSGRTLRSFVQTRDGVNILRESLGVEIQEPEKGRRLSCHVQPENLTTAEALLRKVPGAQLRLQTV